jgi:hypothetical protein
MDPGFAFTDAHPAIPLRSIADDGGPAVARRAHALAGFSPSLRRRRFASG